jgi:hypothetical protein
MMIQHLVILEKKIIMYIIRLIDMLMKLINYNNNKIIIIIYYFNYTF